MCVFETHHRDHSSREEEEEEEEREEEEEEGGKKEKLNVEIINPVAFSLSYFCFYFYLLFTFLTAFRPSSNNSVLFSFL